MIEQEAIAALRQGDINGLAALVNRYQVKAIRTAFLITRDGDSAREVVQDAFLRVYDRIDQYDEKRPFAPWFFRIVTNDAVKAAKRSQRVISLERPTANGETRWHELLPDGMPEPDEQVTAVILRETIWDALGQLTPKQRAAVVMRYYLDMGETEMAGQMQVAPGTVKWHLHAARQRLRHILHKEQLEVDHE